MEKENGQLPDLSSQAVRWDAYRMRESFNLFELACLVHRLDPRAVNDDAVTAVRRHGGPMAEALVRDSVGATLAMYASPAMYFIPPVGDTLEVMKLATNPSIGYSVNKDRAKQIAQGLGYQWPVELEHQAPAPVVAVNTSNASVDSITTAQVAAIFDALPFTAENWPKRLSDTKWLETAQVALGAAGGATSLWNPAKLAQLIHGRKRGEQKQKTLEALNRKFKSNPVLEPWRAAWNEHYAMFNDADGSR